MVTIVRKNTLKLRGLDPLFPILGFIPLEGGNFMIYNKYDLHVFDSKGTRALELKQDGTFNKIQKIKNDTFLAWYPNQVKIFHLPTLQGGTSFLSQILWNDSKIHELRVQTKFDLSKISNARETSFDATKTEEGTREEDDTSFTIQIQRNFDCAIQIFATLRNGHHVVQLSNRKLILLDRDLNLVSENITPRASYHLISEQKRDGLVRCLSFSQINGDIYISEWNTKRNVLSSYQIIRRVYFHSSLSLNDGRILFFETCMRSRGMLHVWNDEKENNFEIEESFRFSHQFLKTVWEQFGTRYFYSFSKVPRFLSLFDAADYSKRCEFEFEEPKVDFLLKDEENNRFVTVDRQGIAHFYHVLERFL